MHKRSVLEGCFNMLWTVDAVPSRYFRVQRHSWMRSWANGRGYQALSTKASDDESKATSQAARCVLSWGQLTADSCSLQLLYLFARFAWKAGASGSAYWKVCQLVLSIDTCTGESDDTDLELILTLCLV